MPKFKDHKELLECGECPFLDAPCDEEYMNHPDWYLCNLQNPSFMGTTCRQGVLLCKANETPNRLMLHDGPDKERKSSCHEITKHIHKVMADAFNALPKKTL